jgi:hypothetical protein
LATFPPSCLNNSPNTILLTPLSPSLPSTFINLPFCPHPSQPPPPAAAHFSAATASSSFPPPPTPAAHFSATPAGSSFSTPPAAAAHFSAAAAGSSCPPPPPATAHFPAATAGSSFPPPPPAAHFAAAGTGSSFPPAPAAHFSAAAAGSSFPPPPPLGQNDEDISPPCSPPQLRIVEDEKEIFMDRYRYGTGTFGIIHRKRIGKCVMKKFGINFQLRNKLLLIVILCFSLVKAAMNAISQGPKTLNSRAQHPPTCTRNGSARIKNITHGAV